MTDHDKEIWLVAAFVVTMSIGMAFIYILKQINEAGL